MNNYPRGKLSADDEGELTIAIYERDNTIIIDFGKDISWLGLSKKEAQEFALNILRRSADRYVSMELPDLPDEKGPRR
jgi:hypothetical protein